MKKLVNKSINVPFSPVETNSIDKGLLAALIVDIHGFSKMCSHEEANCIGQFVRDVFSGSVEPTEQFGGIIANTMGDAILCLFQQPGDAFLAAWSIIHDFWGQHEYLVGCDKLKSKEWKFIEKGLFCRCAIEYGYIDKEELCLTHGTLVMWTGVPINYAQRIIKFPEKENNTVENKRNTLIIGPEAYKCLRGNYEFTQIKGKVKGESFIGYQFDTRDLWGD